MRHAYKYDLQIMSLSRMRNTRITNYSGFYDEHGVP